MSSGELDPAILALIEGADLVIYDCTYTDEEMERFKGYGHSTWQQGIRLCEAAGARRLALFHHDPARTDTALAEIEQMAQAHFSRAPLRACRLDSRSTSSTARKAPAGRPFT